ncbi:MAG: M36 family metallopeptidase, partial [Deltaproteobacteria bacterium]|nr:M36 family metallopeptidase [Deltaproteobacteria bacterium]
SGAMGEGWSDWFAASLYDDPIIGEYVSGNSSKGIRRYALDRNPLTYGDLCQGPNGCEVHDDGEIWSGILWDLREKFIEKYDYEEGKAQVEQLVIDGMKFTLINPSMLDGRDAILAADVADGGESQDLIWKAFACKGMGVSASTLDHNDSSPQEAFDLPDGTDCRGRVELPWIDELREIFGSIFRDIIKIIRPV